MGGDAIQRETIIAYTDGACGGNPGHGGWAFLVGNLLVSGDQAGTTNNMMEMTACLEALLHVPEHFHLQIHTDSKLCIGWLAWGWQCNVPRIQRIRDAFHTIKEVKDVTVYFVKVKGHSNDRFNNIVDKEAVRQSKHS